MAGVYFLDARGPEGIAVYAIGDVHGRLDLLQRMHERIFADMDSAGVFGQAKPKDWRIIHLGDYVDRGPDSKGVIDFLVRASRADSRVISLAGNHDIGFLEFMAEGDPDGLFARYGGVETAKSYGVDLDLAGIEGFKASHRALVEAVPKNHSDFLGSLKFWMTMGDFFFCHAGIRPRVALDQQLPSDLTWIRDEFHRHAELYPKVIVHGHTPVPEPEVLANRVNIDTGAFASGRLTALAINGTEKQILAVE